MTEGLGTPVSGSCKMVIRASTPMSSVDSESSASGASAVSSATIIIHIMPVTSFIPMLGLVDFRLIFTFVLCSRELSEPF